MTFCIFEVCPRLATGSFRKDSLPIRFNSIRFDSIVPVRISFVLHRRSVLFCSVLFSTCSSSSLHFIIAITEVNQSSSSYSMDYRCIRIGSGGTAVDVDVDGRSYGG